MSKAREAIFARLQQALGSSSADTAPETVRQRLAAPVRGPQPQWQEEREARFVAKLEAVAASCVCIDAAEEIVPAVAAYLSSQGVAWRLVSAPHPLLAGLDWPEGMAVERRAAAAEDLLALNVAEAGVAETGSLVLLSGPGTPTTLNFLPDDFLCVVRRSSLVDYMEDVWAALRSRADMPRAVNFITGPSRTADVEQTIQLGAHGPRRLHVILLQD